MRKKKFFIITTVGHTLFFFKGQPRLWKEIYDVTAISANIKDSLVEFASGEGISYKSIPMHREISLLPDLLCLFRFIWLFLKERPYIVHGNTPKASMLSMVSAWLTRRPVRIYMCHGLRYQSTQGVLRFVLMTMEKLSCRCATHVIGVSEGVCKQLVADGLCSDGKAKVIGYGTAGGIDVERFSMEAIKDIPLIRKNMGIPSDDFVFCFVGRIVKDKGIKELVVAFDMLSNEKSNIHLLLIGVEEKDRDPIDDKTREMIKANKRIYAVGRQNDVRPWLAASNAFVLPSYREGVGMVLLEASAMGIPCITSDIIGCNNVVKEGINGELVLPHDSISLYVKMKEWVENPERVSMMASSAREFVLQRYEQEFVKKSAFEFYKSIS